MSDAITDGLPRADGLPVVAKNREQALAETFVVLAGALVVDFDIVDLLDWLVAASVGLLTMTAGGLLLRDQQKGSLAVVASSSEQTRLLDVCQLQNDEGPCLDCVRTGAAVVSGDLDADHTRWPLFAPAARAAGFRSILAVPLRHGDQMIGGLSMFRDRAEAVHADDRRLAQALADAATIGILQQRSAQRHATTVEQLQHALDSRVVIEQAKGVLAERNSIGMDTAFDVLRRYARGRNLKLTELAAAVVRGDIAPVTVLRSAPPS